MANMTTADNCDCPNDCDTNYYTYSISSTKLDIDKVCRKHSGLGDEDISGIPRLMRNFEIMVSGVESGDTEICQKSMENFAYVNFQLNGQNTMQFKRELRVTLADQIANIGKKCCCTSEKCGTF